MSVAVACNLSDGVILGVDSAVSIGAPDRVLKVYENAEKLFQLGKLPIGVATFGLATLGSRTIGSFLREFEIRHQGQALSRFGALADVVEALRAFFMEQYEKIIVPAVEAESKKLFPEIPLNVRPALGFVIGGFSKDAFLSEVWSIVVPHNNGPGSAQRVRAQGDFGSNWFAMFTPIQRYIKGFEPDLVQELTAHFERRMGEPLCLEDRRAVDEILRKYEYQIPFAAMPMSEGIEHTRFLVELVINHHRFAVGAPVVGGKAKVGKVTYRGDNFEILPI